MLALTGKAAPGGSPSPRMAWARAGYPEWSKHLAGTYSAGIRRYYAEQESAFIRPSLEESVACNELLKGVA
jgi:hypothetical protein